MFRWQFACAARPWVGLFGLALAISSICAIALAPGQGPKIDVLRIGTTGSLTGNGESAKEKAGLKTLHQFIQDETGLENEVIRQKDWQELADKMAKGERHVAVFQGHEFAWAQEKYADLKPLAVAVNVHRYPIACVVTRRDNAAKEFGDLPDHALTLSASNQRYLRLFVERESLALRRKADVLFSDKSPPENVEDALDDVVDGKVQASAVDRTALEAYRRRKPGRFNQLKEIARSQPFPPTVVAYYGANLDASALRKFKSGLLGAAGKEKGQMLLTLSRLTGFETVPDNFGKVLAETRTAYPPPGSAGK